MKEEIKKDVKEDVKDDKKNVENGSGSGDDNKATTEGSVQTLSAEEMASRIAYLEKTNADVINSRNEYKSKLNTIETKSEEERVSKAKANEEFEKLYTEQKEQNEKLMNDISSQCVDAALRVALDNEGCKDIATSLKLADAKNVTVVDSVANNKEIMDVVFKLKEQSSLLFGEKTISNIPNVKNSNQGVVESYETRIKLCNGEKELEEFISKNG